MLRLSWEIEGDKQLVRNLRNVSESMGEWKPAFRKTAKELKDIFSNDVFKTEGKAIGVTWPKLKPQYLSQKVSDGYPPNPLIRTGKLKKSFKSLVKIDSATIWNSMYYAKYHQSNLPRRKIPRRVMMKLGNKQKELVVKIFHTYFVKKLR